MKFSMNPLRAVLVASALTVALSGCSTIESMAGHPDQAKLVVQVATMKAIEAGSDHHARAVRIREITTEAKDFLSTENVTVSLLDAAVRARVAKLNLQASDRLLADSLMDVVMADLKQKIGDQVLVKDKLVRVNTVLGWIADTTTYY